jgi:predicted phosphoribosyltransferase
MSLPAKVIDIPSLREREPVFRDRADAGAQLSGMLSAYDQTDALVLAIPAGGVPVAAEIARALHGPLDVAVVSKITLPWNTEAGYGAVSFDGHVRLNERLVSQLGLDPREVEAGIARTRDKVRRRVATLRGDRAMPELAARPAIVVDDGLASGFTMLAALEALRRAGSTTLVVAVPTAHADALRAVAALADEIYCPNVRSRTPFAVAAAYEIWRDVSDGEVVEAQRRLA